MRAALLVALLLLLGVAAKKKDDKEDGADRMRAEIDAHGEMAEEQSAVPVEVPEIHEEEHSMSASLLSLELHRSVQSVSPLPN